MAIYQPEVPEFQERYRENVVDNRSSSWSAEDGRKEAELRYRHLPAEQHIMVDALLRGKQSIADLRPPPARVVRMFVSASFTDMTEERNALMTKAYPKLRTYCREKYGVDFHTVDLRWGVPAEDVHDTHLDQGFYEEQLRRCQATSAGLNFLALIGQKSTPVPLPSSIDREEFVALRQWVNTSEDGVEPTELIDKLYQLDTNVLPNVYRLRLVEEEPDTMRQEKDTLRDILRRAASDQKVDLPVDTPATEQELSAGYVNVTEAEDRSLCYVRTIDDIGKHLDGERAKQFIDLTPTTNCVDMRLYQSVCRMMLALRCNVGDVNITRRSISWCEPHGVDPEVHAEYLDDICDTLHNRIRCSIDNCFDRCPAVVSDSLYHEVVQHWLTAKRHTEVFLGREKELVAIRDHVQGNSSQPLVVFGASGQGKSALLAAAASRVHQWFAESACTVNKTVVMRFCGTTPESSGLRQLLHSICHHLAYAGNLIRSRVPSDFKALKRYFIRLLQGGEFRGLVIIFIDAVDQLDANDAAHELGWFPAQITKNVKVIISTSDQSPNSEHVLKGLLCKITHPRYHLQVGYLGRSTCAAIVKAKLVSVNRTVTYAQSKILREIISQVQHPLFINVTLHEVATWTSSSDIDIDSLSMCVSVVVQRLFQRIEANHGVVLVSHSLAYLTAAKDGISECEMEDILSLDNEVLTEIYADWNPAVFHVPPVAWLRLQRDLGDYVVETCVHEMHVFYWCNSEVNKSARNRYLSDKSKRNRIHNTMADYYLGTWSGGRKKPIESKGLLDKSHKMDGSSSAARYVHEQPLMFDSLTGVGRLNTRKLSQLPYHLEHAQRRKELNENILFNFNWIRTKIRATSLHDVITDYASVDDAEVQLVMEALKMSQPVVEQDINTLSVELAGCLMSYYDTHNSIKSLIDQCDAAALRYCPLVPNWHTHTTPGGLLECICSTNVSGRFDDVDCCLIQDMENGNAFLVHKRLGGNHMKVWDVKHNECRAGLKLPSNTRVYPTPDGSHVNVFTDKGIVETFHFRSREKVGGIVYEADDVGDVVVSNTYMAFTYLQRPSPIVLNTEASLLIESFRYHSHALAISEDERHLICNNDHSIMLHSLPLMEHKCTAKVQQLPKRILATRNNVKFYAMLWNKDIVCIIFNLTQKTGKVNRIIGDLKVQDFKLAHGEEMILVRASRRIYIIDVTSETSKVLHCIQKMPDGVFVDDLSVFSNAGFSMDDRLVLATRHTYLAVWNSRTGEPLRLLQSSVSPVVRLLTCDVMNKAITILADSSLQVWNFDNLDAEVVYVDTVVRGSVTSLAVSEAGQRVVCSGDHHAEARVIDFTSGSCERLLEHTFNVYAHLDSVLISPLGTYAVTRMKCEQPNCNDNIYDDKLWHIENGEEVTHIENNCFIAFSPNDEKFVCFPRDGEIGTPFYTIQLLNMVSHDCMLIEESYGRIFGEPFITDTGDYMVFTQEESDCAIDQDQSQQNSVLMCIHSFGKTWYAIRRLSVHDVWAGADGGESFVNVQLFSQDQVIAIFQKQQTVSPNAIAKSALIYDVRKGCLLRRLDDFLRPESDVMRLSFSSHKSMFVDSNYEMYDIVAGSYIGRLPLHGIVSPGSLRLVLNGKYAAAISVNRRELLVFRTADCYRKARVFLHGTASRLQVCGAENRTLLLGCDDGRVISYTVVLDSADHVKDITCALPSRRRRPRLTTQSSALSTDLKHISRTVNEHRQLSASRRVEERDKPASFKAVARDAVLVNSYQRENSENCATQ